MTNEEIRNLPAGYATDALVAEHVFAFPARRVRAKGTAEFVLIYGDNPAYTDGVWTEDELCRYGAPPAYSTDMAEAWKVVEKLTSYEYVKVRCEASHYHGDYCSVIAPDPTQMPEGRVFRDALAVAGETMPLAVCRAALIALGDDK